MNRQAPSNPKLLYSKPLLWIMIILLFTAAAVITVIAVVNWAGLQSTVEIAKEDSLVFRALLSNPIVLGIFRVFAVVAMIFLAVAFVLLLFKLLNAAVVNLWGLELKSETREIEAELQEKDRTIEKLESENKSVNALLDALHEVIQTTSFSTGKRRKT
jgi:hypothetical protein